MGNLHPATPLMIAVWLLMMLGVPVLAWVTVVRRQNDMAATQWYSGLAMSGVGAPTVAVLQQLSRLHSLLDGLVDHFVHHFHVARES